MLSLVGGPAYAQDAQDAEQTPEAGPVYVPGRLIVGVTGDNAPTMQAAGALQAFGVEVVQPTDSCVTADLAGARVAGEPGPTIVQVWQVAPGAEESAMELLRQQPGIAFVERDIYMYAAQEGVDPDGRSEADEEDQLFEIAYSINDPLYAEYQWGPQRANFARLAVDPKLQCARYRARGGDRQRRRLRPSGPGDAAAQRQELSRSEQPAERRQRSWYACGGHYRRGY
jgi:hypothetical protein